MSFDLKQYVQSAPIDPGVYQMIDITDRVLYVGKAKNLRNRLGSYINPEHPRVQHLIKKIHRIVITLCTTEEEALLLEHRLIQHIQPPFNILLKDHKGYPFLVLTSEPYPQIHIERSLKKKSEFSQGPYPTLDLAKQILDVILKTFQLRTCSDYVFKTRSRPCLQYQMQRCSAPCVFQSLPDQTHYATQVSRAKKFLKEGLGDQITQLESQMMISSGSEDFEMAATLRDHIKKLRMIQRQSRAAHTSNERIDVIAYNGSSMAHHLMIFEGRIQLSQSLSIRNPLQLSVEQCFETILYQLYERLDPQWAPALVLGLIEEPLKVKIHGYTLRIRTPKGEHEIQWMQTAQDSLQHNKLSHNKKSDEEYEAAFQALEQFFLQSHWNAIECVDVAHHQGSHVVGAVCRFDRQGPARKDYRKYRLARDQLSQNNDPLSISQTLVRHLKRRRDLNQCPNLFIVDGGKAQLNAAYEIVKSIEIENMIVMSMSKDRSRKNGLETFWVRSFDGGCQEIDLTSVSSGMLLLQELRDESHRVAGQFHYQQAKKHLLRHGLDDFKGLGEAKKLRLLQTFGGWQGLKQAQLQQLREIEGIGEKIALRLLEYIKQRP